MRTTKTILLHDSGRPLRFAVRLMPALHMEAWLERAAELQPDHPGATPAHPAALAAHLLRRGPFALACAGGEPAAALLDEMLSCCSYIDPESNTEIPCSREFIGGLISDLRTLLALRRAVLRENLSFAREGIRKPLPLPKEAAYRRASGERTAARTVNVPQVSAILISQGVASLNDLRGGYTFADALDLLEVVNVRNYNQWAANEAARSRRR